MASVIALGCGSAETFDQPGGPEQPPSAAAGGAACREADPAIGAPDAACGVFVSSSLGSDEDPGTPERPVRTLAEAFALAAEGQRRVYGCAEVFQEPAEVPGGMELRGGLDCAQGWAYVGDARKTTIAPGAAGVIALRVLAGEGTTRVADVRAEAASGEQAGESSIAALVEPGTVIEIERCELVAGDGAAGETGEQPKGGASGGSGGAGGCGGKGAKGGGSGGASIGIISLGAEVRIRATMISTGSGGDGGRGGLWQGGGHGGQGGSGGHGMGSGSGCYGGPGGQGGNGGLGGGGLGGPSIGVAHIGDQPRMLEEVTITRGKGGEGGPGGSPFVTLPGTNGEHGLEADVQSFPEP